MINLKDIPPFKNAPMGFEFHAHRMYEGFSVEMLDCSWELTGEFRFVSKDDEGYLSWDDEGFLVVVPGGVRPVSRIRAPRLILKRKPQPSTHQPRMAVTEADVYGPDIPPIPEGWEDDGFCIIKEDVHEAYLDTSGEVRNTKQYALVGMVRIALRRKPQPAAPDSVLALGNCFYGGKHGTYLKVITEPRWESTINTTARQYLQLYPGSTDPISLRWLPDVAMPCNDQASFYRPIPKDVFLNHLLGVLESIDGRGVKA